MRAGILSDTHLTHISESFKIITEKAFAGCDMIFHAGDITSAAVMSIFSNKIIHAVHGNMCDYSSKQQYPESKSIKLQEYTIGICHGTGPRHNIEERMWSLFPDADCIIYGHTHQPVCENKGGILFINPGSFHCVSPHGAPASYAILEVTKTGLKAKIHTISLSR